MSCSTFIHFSSKHMNYEKALMTGRGRRRRGAIFGSCGREILLFFFFSQSVFSLECFFLLSLSDTRGQFVDNSHTLARSVEGEHTTAQEGFTSVCAIRTADLEHISCSELKLHTLYNHTLFLLGDTKEQQ